MVYLRNMCMATLNKGDNDVVIIIIIIIIIITMQTVNNSIRQQKTSHQHAQY